ncbi:succinylglutamate desuccinylase [Chitinivorax tropicus]|uniref:Succinylglutamate desuccinylase n=1 Tax=Chitinivorax tropicus TaxID=714531 RepID=A0A840ME79_9PROT|nr:succinylglutamate desuccinylase [Chitinivorax tropicus]MBB5016988.1 succinylglutamate desuccinylase [Chitinivorax tropicus]
MPTSFLQALLDNTPLDFMDGPLPDGSQGQMLGEGAWLVEPVRSPVMNLVISCGIHGNETAPIELVGRLIEAIRTGILCPQSRVLFVMGNLDAMRAGKRYLVEDINRLFCGKHGEVAMGAEPARAAALEQVLQQFFAGAEPHTPRWHFDLHTAIRGSYYEKFAIYPFVDGLPHDPQAVALLGACDIQTMLLHSKPSPTFSYHASHHFGAKAFTLELGKARPFGQNAGVDVSALERVLAGMIAGVLPALPDYDPAAFRIFEATRDVIKTSAQFKLNLAPDVQNFTPLEAGYVVAEDAGHRVVVQPGEHIIFPNPDVKVGLRAGILVAPAQLKTKSGANAC